MESWPTVTGLDKNNFVTLKLLLTFSAASNYFKKAKLLTEINLPLTRVIVSSGLSEHNESSKNSSRERIPGRNTAWENRCDTHRSKMDDSLRGHRASHEANELQLGTMLRNSSHGSIGHLDKERHRKEALNQKWKVSILFHSFLTGSIRFVRSLLKEQIPHEVKRIGERWLASLLHCSGHQAIIL